MAESLDLRGSGSFGQGVAAAVAGGLEFALSATAGQPVVAQGEGFLVFGSVPAPITGPVYSPTLGGPHPAVTASFDAEAGTMTVTARTDLAAGNAIEVTSSSSNVTWDGTTLHGGGAHGITGIEVPDGLPPVSVAVLKSHVMIGIGKSDRFYWLQPGSLEIDPLDFATAESQPDDVISVITSGDNAWFVGEGSTEVWYATGNSSTPFAPVGGRVFDQGAIAGTVVNIQGIVFLVGRDHMVYAVGGSAQRISNHGVEEEIRKALGVSV